MKQILQNFRSGETSIEECPAPSIKKNSLKILTRMSLISAGTERMLVNFSKSSYFEKAKQQPEKVKQVINKISTDGILTTYDSVKSKLDEPIALGYSNVGVIDELPEGITDFKLGDRVVSNGPHADLVIVNKNLCAIIPDNVDDDEAAFTVVGSIALQGLRLSNPNIGENYVVFGVGLIGLITVQLLKANGCNVLAIDFDNKKLDLAKQYGAKICNPNEDDIVSASNSFSLNRGSDGVIITASTQSNDVIKQAAQISRKRGKIILVGVVGLDIDRDDFYEKELTFQVSCSYGPGRYDSFYEEKGHDYPYAFVRWTEQRNFEAILSMLSSGTINFKGLISKSFLFEDAVEAYDYLNKSKDALGIIINYTSDENDRKKESVQINNNSFIKTDPIIGFIGCGNYASRVLIPAFKKSNAQLHTISSQGGVSSKINSKKYNFAYSTSNTKALLKNNEINTVVVTTRHNSHSSFVIKALKNNKNVWVEKPLSLTADELDDVIKVYKSCQRDDSRKSPQLMIGFNRRFAPHIRKIKTLLSSKDYEKKSILITVNAGKIPSDNWIQDKAVGGGRILGEGCHFIDLIRFIGGSKITSVSTNKMDCIENLNDNVSISVRLENGSIGTILYLSNGASSYQKEQVEIFTNGKVLKLDNYKTLYGYGWKNFRKMSLFKQDKGQNACVQEFINSIKSGNACIHPDDIFEVSKWSIEASKSAQQ
jgi:predicted dehydrogenase/threonine dehydrogenase-like Zn-dependent dehydrogenase